MNAAKEEPVKIQKRSIYDKMPELDGPSIPIAVYSFADKTGQKIYTYQTKFNANYQPEEASIYSVDVTTKTYTKFFAGTYFYGVGVSPSTGNLFTAEVSFTSNSLLKVVGTDGTLKTSASAGIGTCRYLFF